MIPKIIHYCWFGGKEKPENVLKMIASWKKHCPDYEIKEWNETNFDIQLNRYTKEAYQQKKWAFVSDVARLWALVHEGGIYMDTDVEVIRPLDNLLANKAFIGFEGTQWIGTNLMGTEPHNAFLQAFLEDYNHRNFTNPDGTLNQTTNVEEITSRFLTQHNLERNGKQQQAGDFTVCGFTAEEARNKIIQNAHLLPYPIRIEKNVTWLHIDTLPQHNIVEKVYLF